MGKKLSEMQSGAKVHLTASAGLNTLEFDTSIVQAGEGHIIVEPIKHDDKILNFSNNFHNFSLVLPLLSTCFADKMKF